MSTEEKLLSMETPMSRLLANSGGGLENAETPKMTSLGLPPCSVLTATTASDTINPWGGGYQGSSSDNKLIDLAKMPIRVIGTAVTLGTYSTGLGGYEPVEFKERGDLRVQHDGDTGSTIIERLDPVDGKWKSEEGVAYRDFALETGGEAKFVVNDEILTASTGGRPIHEPGKHEYVDIAPYPNREDHDTTTPPYPMAEQDKDSHILSNPLPVEKLPWKTETPADRVDEPTVMLNEEIDNANIDGARRAITAANKDFDLSNLKPGQPLPDNLEIVVTGSNNSPGNYILRPGVDDRPIGTVKSAGKSATIATNLSIETEITTMFGRELKKGDTISAGFVEDVRAAGFDVVYAPTENNERHVRIIPNISTFNEAGRELLSEALDKIERQKN